MRGRSGVSMDAGPWLHQYEVAQDCSWSGEPSWTDCCMTAGVDRGRDSLGDFRPLSLAQTEAMVAVWVQDAIPK